MSTKEKQNKILIAKAISKSENNESKDGASLVFQNSPSYLKAAELQRILDDVFGQGIISVQVLRALAEQYTETDIPDSELVASQKSLYFKEKLGPDFVTAGADTVFRIKRGDRWEDWTKLERLGRDLTAEETVDQYEYLYQLLCNPDGGEDKMIWDVSLAITNGEVDTFNERIYIKYSPIDKELFEAFFWEAVDKRLIYKYNSRMAMIEMLAVSGRVKEMAFMEKDGNLKRMVRKPNESLLKLAILDISTTMPNAFLNDLTTDRPIWLGENFD